MPADPEFTPGAVRARLEWLDHRIAAAESNILDGRCPTMEDIRFQQGRRQAFIECRTETVKSLDEDTRRRLGLPGPSASPQTPARQSPRRAFS